MEKEEFDRLFEKWMRDTGVYSTINHIMEHENVPVLVAAKESILPFLMEKLEDRRCMGIFEMLKLITGCNIVPKHHSSRSNLMAADWQHWYKEIYKRSN